ncbi:Uncharacterized protein ZOSMA_81G00350 [Zostera marina]|uniref:Stress-response A/B barrel domain-containing protein n=1 Tax=Zostera marina TaxID=29655 RepID=A0A0K9NP12_ZOSMR|nr:Uncharacterized protein ZOSMA_81G00350 [Zostera marina]
MGGEGGGDTKHLVLVKFKEDTVVEDLMNDMGSLVSDLDIVKSFEWGEDVGSMEMLRQGFTHVFVLTFKNEQDFTAYSNHPKHVEFSGKFAASIEKVLLFHFPAVSVKLPPSA